MDPLHYILNAAIMKYAPPPLTNSLNISFIHEDIFFFFREQHIAFFQ